MSRDKEQLMRYAAGYFDSRKGDTEQDFQQYQQQKNLPPEVSFSASKPRPVFKRKILNRRAMRLNKQQMQSQQEAEMFFQPQQIIQQEFQEMKEILEMEISDTETSSTISLSQLLAGTQVDTPDNNEVSSSLFYFVRSEENYKTHLLDHYIENIYPKEIEERQQKEIATKESTLFVSPDDLYRLICEDQIKHMNNNAHHICINLTSLPAETLPEYQKIILGFLSPEIVKEQRAKVIVNNKNLARALSTPDFKMDFI